MFCAGRTRCESAQLLPDDISSCTAVLIILSSVIFVELQEEFTAPPDLSHFRTVPSYNHNCQNCLDLQFIVGYYLQHSNSAMLLVCCVLTSIGIVHIKK